MDTVRCTDRTSTHSASLRHPHRCLRQNHYRHLCRLRPQTQHQCQSRRSPQQRRRDAHVGASVKGPNIRYERVGEDMLFTPLNEGGVAVLRRGLEGEAPSGAGDTYEWQGDSVLVTDLDLLDRLEIFLAVASRLDSYIDGRPVWALKGGESLEDAYERHVQGQLSKDEAHEAASNDCECGGIARCWSEAHEAMREALTKA